MNHHSTVNEARIKQHMNMGPVIDDFDKLMRVQCTVLITQAEAANNYKELYFKLKDHKHRMMMPKPKWYQQLGLVEGFKAIFNF